jgi:hypothetical protein
MNSEDLALLLGLIGGVGGGYFGGKRREGLGSLGSKMMDNLKNYISRPTGSSPMGPMGIFPGMNQGGSVGLTTEQLMEMLSD